MHGLESDQRRGVFGRGTADQFLEVVDEMRLIEVPQILRQISPFRARFRSHAFERFIYSIAFDNRARARADIPVEQPLQRPLPDTTSGDEMLDTRYVAIPRNLFNRVPRVVYTRIP